MAPSNRGWGRTRIGIQHCVDGENLNVIVMSELAGGGARNIVAEPIDSMVKPEQRVRRRVKCETDRVARGVKRPVGSRRQDARLSEPGPQTRSLRTRWDHELCARVVWLQALRFRDVPRDRRHCRALLSDDRHRTEETSNDAHSYESCCGLAGKTDAVEALRGRV